MRCAALPREGLAEEFPRDGTLLFFSFDGQADDEVFVSLDDPATRVGARVLYIPENTPVLPAEPPPVVEACPLVELGAARGRAPRPCGCPRPGEPCSATIASGRNPRDTPAELKPFIRAFRRLRTLVGHQIGGQAVPVQGPVEYEIANATHGGAHAWGDEPLDREAERWVPLAQFAGDADAKATGGDEVVLYWLIRPEDLAAHRFDQARLIVQG